MAGDAILDKIFSELEAAPTDDMRLRISGEEMARFNEQLKKSKSEEESVLLAKRILILTELHAGILLNTENPEQAPLTVTGELCLILSCKVNPEKLPLIYVGSLLTAIRGYLQLNHILITSKGPDAATAHIESITISMVQLFLATYDVYRKFADLSVFAADAEFFRMHAESLPEECKMHGDRKITPYLALDICYDALARMSAAGLYPEE